MERYTDPLSACFGHALAALKEGRTVLLNHEPELEAELEAIRFEREPDGCLRVPIREIEAERGPLARARAFALQYATRVVVEIDDHLLRHEHRAKKRLKREVAVCERRIEEHEASGRCTDGPLCPWVIRERGALRGLLMGLAALERR